MQQPSGIQRSSEPVAPRRLPKNSLRESLENVGALSKTLFFLPSSFLLPPPVVRGLLARGHVYSFGSFLRPALVCSQNVSPPPLPTPPEQVPVRLWGFLGTSVVPPHPVRLWGFPHDGCGFLEGGSGPVSRCRAGPAGGPRGAGSQELPRGDSSRVAAARWLSVPVEPF